MPPPTRCSSACSGRRGEHRPHPPGGGSPPVRRHRRRPRPGRRPRGAGPATGRPVMTRDELLAYCLAKPGAWSDQPWEGDYVAKVADKIFAFTGDTSVGVKAGANRDEADEWIRQYPDDASVMAYIGRSGWNSLRLDGAIPDEELRGTRWTPRTSWSWRSCRRSAAPDASRRWTGIRRRYRRVTRWRRRRGVSPLAVASSSRCRPARGTAPGAPVRTARGRERPPVTCSCTVTGRPSDPTMDVSHLAGGHHRGAGRVPGHRRGHHRPPPARAVDEGVPTALSRLRRRWPSLFGLGVWYSPAASSPPSSTPAG